MRLMACYIFIYLRKKGKLMKDDIVSYSNDMTTTTIQKHLLVYLAQLSSVESGEWRSEDSSVKSAVSRPAGR